MPRHHALGVLGTLLTLRVQEHELCQLRIWLGQVKRLWLLALIVAAASLGLECVLLGGEEVAWVR